MNENAEFSIEKKNMLTIGELSKITGVHVKALRYYDSLDILIPDYIDPDSGYRYYNLQQILVIDAIQLCVDLGIPLKDFSKYINRENFTIHYYSFVEDGLDILQKKIKELQNKLTAFELMKEHILRSEKIYANPSPQIYSLPAQNCWISPCSVDQNCKEFYSILKRELINIYKAKLHINGGTGLLLLRKGIKWERFFFIHVDSADNTNLQHPNVINIPAGKAICKKMEQSNIDSIWEWIPKFVPEDRIYCVMEVDLFNKSYTLPSPTLELRCFLRCSTEE